MDSISWLLEITTAAVMAATLAATLTWWCRLELRRRRASLFQKCTKALEDTVRHQMEQLDDRFTERLFQAIALPLTLFVAGLLPPSSGVFAFLASASAFSICATRLIQAIDERHAYRLAIQTKVASAGKSASAPRIPGHVHLFLRQTAYGDEPALIMSLATGERLLLPQPGVQSKL